MAQLNLFAGKRPVPKNEISSLFETMRDRKVLQANGGFLLKVRICAENVFMGVIPVITQGHRNKHFEIFLPRGNGSLYSGFFNSDETLGLLPVPSKGKDYKSEPARGELIQSYRLWAALLIEWEWPFQTLLDWTTQKVLEELGISEPGPKTLNDLKSVKM